MARSKANGALKAASGYARPGERRTTYTKIEETSSPQQPELQERTDYSRWRLLDERGRQTWHYLEHEEEAKEWPQSTADKYFLGLPTVRKSFNHTIFYLLTSERVFQIFPPRKHPSMLLRMVLTSSNIFNFLRATGPANMADRCFFSPDWL